MSSFEPSHRLTGAVELADAPGATTEEVRPGVVLDFDADGRLVGIDIEDASRVTDLKRLEVESLPVLQPAR